MIMSAILIFRYGSAPAFAPPLTALASFTVRSFTVVVFFPFFDAFALALPIKSLPVRFVLPAQTHTQLPRQFCKFRNRLNSGPIGSIALPAQHLMVSFRGTHAASRDH